jgi:hypothetical protein
MSAGKGDARRPYDAEQYGKNYDSIFRRAVQDVCTRVNDCNCTEEIDPDHDSHDEEVYREI